VSKSMAAGVLTLGLEGRSPHDAVSRRWRSHFRCRDNDTRGDLAWCQL